MNRLNIINFINPSWHRQITEFLAEHPKFNRLVPIVALDEYPNGFNKNPHETTDDDAPVNIFEIVIYGLALANCDEDYGKNQYSMVVNYLRNYGPFHMDMEFPKNTQPEKEGIYRRFINRLLERNIPSDQLRYEDINEIEDVEGMTESTITLLHLLFGEITSDKCLPYGDKQFKRGMAMFYGLEQPPSKETLKKITETWRNKKVGLMFVVQYAHYSEYVDT